MATTTIDSLTAHTLPVLPADRLMIRTGTTDRKVTVANILTSLGCVSVAFASLPSGYTGGMIYVTDGRKVGEGSGLGTGVVCTWNGSNWITIDDGSTVAN